MKFFVVGALVVLTQGCGVSHFRCEIVSDEELLRDVMTEVINGVNDAKAKDSERKE